MERLETLIENGHKALDQKDYQVAKESFEQAVSLDPISAEANYGMGLALGDLNLWQEAAKAFKHVVRIEPESERGHACLGLSYIKLQLWQLAIDAFSNVIQINPNEADAYTQIGFAYGKLENWQKAIEFHEKAKSLALGNAELRLALAVDYLMAGDEERGWDEYEALKEMDENLARELLEVF